MKPLDENNLHEGWIEEIKDRVNSIDSELPADGFDAVMNSIRRRKRAKVIKLISYCAAAAIILLLLPTIYISREIGGNFKAYDSTDMIAVVKRPSAPDYIAQNNRAEQRTKNATNDEYVTTAANNVKYSIVGNATADSAIAENRDETGTTDNSALENTVTEKSEASLGNAITESTLTENTLTENTLTENAEPKSIANINLTFSDQEEWDKAEAESSRKGRNRKIYREEKGVSIALNAGNAAGGGTFLGKGYYDDDIKGLQDMEPARNFLYDINQGVNRVENKDLGKFDNSAFSTTEKNLSHITDIRENKIDLRGGHYNHKLPLKFGVTAAVKIYRNLYFESGLSYSYLRSDIKKNNEKISQKLHYIGVPVSFNWYFVNSKFAGLYLGAGCNINKCIYASIGNESFGIGKFETSLNLQAGFLGKLSRNVGIFVQPGVTFMLSDNEELTNFNNFTVQNYYSDKDFSITFDAGLRFSF